MEIHFDQALLPQQSDPGKGAGDGGQDRCGRGGGKVEEGNDGVGGSVSYSSIQFCCTLGEYNRPSWWLLR